MTVYLIKVWGADTASCGILGAFDSLAGAVEAARVHMGFETTSEVTIYRSALNVSEPADPVWVSRRTPVGSWYTFEVDD